jgi:hypothetical protein
MYQLSYALGILRRDTGFFVFWHVDAGKLRIGIVSSSWLC